MNGVDHVLPAPPRADISHIILSTSNFLKKIQVDLEILTFKRPTTTSPLTCRKRPLQFERQVLLNVNGDGLIFFFFYEWRLWYAN